MALFWPKLAPLACNFSVLRIHLVAIRYPVTQHGLNQCNFCHSASAKDAEVWGPVIAYHVNRFDG